MNVSSTLGLFDDAQPGARAARADRCGPALQDLAEAVDRYVLGVAGESVTEQTLAEARHDMVAALERAWDVLRPVHRLRVPSDDPSR